MGSFNRNDRKKSRGITRVRGNEEYRNNAGSEREGTHRRKIASAWRH